MPTYDYSCCNCDLTFEKFSPISMRNKPLEEPCPQCKAVESVLQVIGAPKIVSGVKGLSGNTPSGFKEVLQSIDNKYGKHSKINT